MSSMHRWIAFEKPEGDWRFKAPQWMPVLQTAICGTQTLHIDAHDTGFFKKNRHPMKYHTTDVVYRPLRSPDQCCCLHFVFGGLPITALKLGVAGVSKAPMWFHGCFFEEPGDVFLVPKCSEIFQSSLPVTNPPKWPNGKLGDLFLFKSILY